MINYLEQWVNFYQTEFPAKSVPPMPKSSSDLNITENIAIAYSNVEVKDEKSVMQAQVITMDIITKDIEINSEDKIKIFIK